MLSLSRKTTYCVNMEDTGRTEGRTRSEQSLFQLPEEFVGWAGNIAVSSLKMYGSLLTMNYIQQQYEAYAQSIGLDILQMIPCKDDESLQDVFFKGPHNSQAFSHHCNNQTFYVAPATLDNSNLLALLNFASDDGTMSLARRAKQEMFLREFIGSYKGFQSGKSVSNKEDYVCSNVEMLDKAYYIHLGLAYSPADTIIFEEVGITGQSVLPHGSIDLVAFINSHKPRVAVSMQCFLIMMPWHVPIQRLQQ